MRDSLVWYTKRVGKLEAIQSWLNTKRAVTVIFAAGFLTFFNALFNGFLWDDEEQVLNNGLIHSISNFPYFFASSTFNTGGVGTLGGLYYKPVMLLFFSLLYSLSGPNAFLFHLFQISVHIASTIFLFLVFKKLFKEITDKNLTLLALAGALLFLVHPISSETVVYISNLQDILYFFFGIIAFWLALSKKLDFKKLCLFGFLLLLSLLSKETGLLFVPLTALYLLIYRRKELKNFILTAVSVGIIYSLLRFALAGIYFRKHGLSPITLLPLTDRLINIPAIIVFYLKTFFYPANLAINQHWVIREVNWSSFFLPLVLSALFFTFLCFMGFFIFKRDKNAFKLYLFFSGWFLLGLAFHLQIIPLDVTVTDRWFYFPLVGLLGMMAVIVSNFQPCLPAGRFSFFKSSYLVAPMIIIFILSVRTMIRNADFKDGLTLFSHDVNISGGAFDLENNYGVELFRVGKLDEAVVHFEKSAQMMPQWWINWNNLGTVYWQRGDTKTAKIYYQKAIDNGQYFLAYENMADLLLATDGPKAAEEFAKNSLKLLPLNSKLWQTLALSNYQLGDKTAALEDIKKSFSISPTQQNYYILSRLQNNQLLDLKSAP